MRTLLYLLFLVSFLLVVSAQEQCAKTCHEVNCSDVGLRYGKYCGVGHGGCDGEQPCDAVDKCCMQHDRCVTKRGVLSNDCHRSFINCLNKLAKKQSDDGFSKQCPWSTVIPVMKTGISMAMMFGSDEL